MALQIKIVENLKTNKKVVRVLDGGTIFQLIRQIKKIARDYRKFEKANKDETVPMWKKQQIHEKWKRNSKFVSINQD